MVTADRWIQNVSDVLLNKYWIYHVYLLLHLLQTSGSGGVPIKLFTQSDKCPEFRAQVIVHRALLPWNL